jgi:hypothetical protein
MSDAASNDQRDVYARRSLLGDVNAWLHAMPIKQLVRSPAMLDLAVRILARTPAAVTQRIVEFNRQMAAHNQVAQALGVRNEPLHPVYYSAGMPGPFLIIPDDPATGPGSDAARSRDLYEWYQSWSTEKFHTRSRDWIAAPFIRGRRGVERS